MRARRVVRVPPAASASPVFEVRGGTGSRILLDTEGAGEVRVRIRNGLSGGVIPGFDFGDCRRVAAPGRRVPVEWYAAAGKNGMKAGLRDLARLDGRYVQVEFKARSARVRRLVVEPGLELPLRLGAGPHLFIDEFLIVESRNVVPATSRPKRHPVPVVGGRSGGVSAGSLVFDEERGVFRMWHWTRGRPQRTQVVYRESADGLDWPGRARAVFTFDGYGTKVIDDGPGCREPDRRFKLAYFALTPPCGMYVAFSAEGLHWLPYEGNPVLPYYPPGHRKWVSGVGDIIDAVWDAPRQRFSAFVKMFSQSSEEFGQQSRTLREGLGVRLTGQTFSRDFVDWAQPWRVFVPDDDDEGVTEFYGGEVLARGDLLIAFLRVLRDDLPADEDGPCHGIGYTVLATSRDGRHWERRRAAFLDRHPDPKAHDHAFAWITGAARHEGQVYLCYAAYDRGHKIGRRSCGMATIEDDRFVAREAGRGERGFLRTRLLVYTGRELPGLWLNADAAQGRVRVQVRDVNGRVIPGFSFSDGQAVTGNGPDLVVQFAKPFVGLSGRPFRLDFSVENAKVYGFAFGKSV